MQGVFGIYIRVVLWKEQHCASGDAIDDRAFLATLFDAMLDELPAQKKKRK